ncbi:MAG: hypothetical protein OXN27_20240 [Candidatus Poribacteria bacterium]|nr:hypothetical protein [Candidatus Poribacteria bacterium]
MNRTLRLLALIVIGLFVFLISGCSSRSRPYIELDGIGFSAEFGRLNKRSDPVRHVQGGARLILAYDLQSRSITGHVENMTHQTLKRVRVTVRLSNGIKLGPTRVADLSPGATQEIKFAEIDGDFTGWTAHVEVGGNED